MWKRISLASISLILIVFLAKVLYGAATAPPLGAHFPQKIFTQNAYMEALVGGKLTLDNGCLRVNAAVSGDGMLLIWDSRFSTHTEQGIVQVVDSSTGEVLASIGDLVAVSGGGAPKWMWLKQPIPDECLGPYYFVGESIKKIDRP